MARFQTKVTHARFVVTGYTPEQMVSVGTALRDSIERRILQALDVNDAAAPPLKVPVSKPASRGGRKESYINNSYPFQKQKRGLQAIRDWRYTGRTLRSMKVLRAAVNRAVIGFTDAETNMRAYINNRRSRQFGVSPVNRRDLVQAFVAVRSFVQVKRVA